MLVMAYGRSYGLPVITTRGNNVYGPHQFPEKLIPKFLLLAMRGQRLPIHGDGTNVRSYLYCEDVAEAFEVVLHRGEVGHVYNIGTKKERTVMDVARDICGLFGLDADEDIEFVDNRPFNDQRYFLDDEKLKSLGWRERTHWEEGLRKTMEWYVANPDYWGDVSGALLPHPKAGGGVMPDHGLGSKEKVKGMLDRFIVTPQSHQGQAKTTVASSPAAAAGGAEQDDAGAAAAMPYGNGANGTTTVH
jgi:UDP-glucose 4,6-dehydratase